MNYCPWTRGFFHISLKNEYAYIFARNYSVWTQTINSVSWKEAPISVSAPHMAGLGSARDLGSCTQNLASYVGISIFQDSLSFFQQSCLSHILFWLFSLKGLDFYWSFRLSVLWLRLDFEAKNCKQVTHSSLIFSSKFQYPSRILLLLATFQYLWVSFLMSKCSEFLSAERSGLVEPVVLEVSQIGSKRAVMVLLYFCICILYLFVCALSLILKTF